MTDGVNYVSLAEEVDGDLLARYRQRKIIRQKYAEELEDIDAYGNHLRSTIVRLRRKPIQRLRSWLHICSAQQAFGRSLTAYAVISCLGLIELNCLQQLLLVDESEISFALFSRWEEIRAPMLYANWLAAGLMLATLPAVYLYRRVELSREYRMQLRLCKHPAAADPDRLVQELYSEDASDTPLQPSDRITSWSGPVLMCWGSHPWQQLRRSKKPTGSESNRTTLIGSRACPPRSRHSPRLKQRSSMPPIRMRFWRRRAY